MNNFWQRTLTGILFVIVLAGSIYYHPLSFASIFLLVVVAGIHEMRSLFSKVGIDIPLYATSIFGLSIYTFSFLIQFRVFNTSIFYFIIPIVCFLFVKELFRQHDKPIVNIASSIFTAIYISSPFALLSLLAFDNGTYNFQLPLSVFILVWMNDTGAYLSGVTIGKHKFFERISPKKTWEGTIGGFILTIAVAFLLSQFWFELSVIQWLIFGAIISVMAVLGDLVESMFKRSIGIKDSGNILPGHGGILDRFDAVFFAIPMAVFYVELFVR